MYKNYQGREISSESQNCNRVGCKCEISPHSRHRFVHFWQRCFNSKNRNFNKYQNTIAFANASCNRSCLCMRKKLLLLLAALSVAIIPGRATSALSASPTNSEKEASVLRWKPLINGFGMPTHPVDSYVFGMPTHPVDRYAFGSRAQAW